MYEPTRAIDEWVMVIYENRRRFNDREVEGVTNGLKNATAAVGMLNIPV